MPRQTAIILPLFVWVLGFGWAAAQEAPKTEEDSVPVETPAAANEIQIRANNAKELVKQMNEEAKKDQLRIKEIEKVLFPYEDKVAQELFFMAPGEYTFLRRQADGARMAAQYFQAQQKIDGATWDGVSYFFDSAYEAMRAGYLWVGREQGLVNDDVQLFNDLRSKVQEEMRKRPEGQEMLKLAAEREQLLSKSRASAPLLKYFNERRLWWKAYPDYESTIAGPNP